MIACLRFKRVRRLLHRYVVPGLCASAIALGGCVMPAITPPSAATGSATKGPIATVSMEPSIQVGDVTAVYVTVTNLRPVDVMPGQNQVIVLQAHMVGQSGGQVERLDVDHAIEKVGTADKLLAALGDRSFDVVAFPPAPPAPEPSGAQVVAGTAAAILLVPLAVMFVQLWAPPLLTGAIQYAVASDKEKIELYKEFPVGRFNGFIEPQFSMKGYLFFPRGSYSTLEITAGAIDDSSVPPETRCGGWLGLCVSASAVVSQQIDRGESPTLRHTETIRCPWRQESVTSAPASREERP